MLVHLVETLQMDHSSRANLKGDEGNIMMVVLTQVEILSSFPFSSLFKESVEATRKYIMNKCLCVRYVQCHSI